MLAAVLRSGYFRAIVYVLASHSVFYTSELIYQRYCAPAKGFWHSLFTNGSTPCVYLRNVSLLSSNALYTLATASSFLIGSYTTSLLGNIRSKDELQWRRSD